MSCSSSYAFGSVQDASEALSSGATVHDRRTMQRRRHSSFVHHRRKSLVNQIMDGEEALLLKVHFSVSVSSITTNSEKVDLFLSDLERRLESFENYGDLMHLDAGIAKTFLTLQAVRERCSHVSEEVIGAGRRRLQIMVETLDARYQGALARAESMNEKARMGIELLDHMLEDFESRAVKLRDQGFANAAGAAESLMGEGRRVMDEGLERARGVVDESIGRAMRAAESLEEHVQNAIARAREKGLLKYDELPVPWRINPHILKGYRFSDSKIECVRSVFGVSNETVNIWSHALGFFIILAVAFYFYPTSANFSLYTKTDVFIAAVFFFAACKCLVCSTIWHTMNCVADQTLMERFACIDYTGISLLIAASIMTTEYTVFYCEPVSRWAYMTATAVLGIAGTILPWHPTFNGQEMAWLRVGFFIGLGATGFLPIFQIILTRGSASAYDFYLESNLLKSLLVYVIGAFVYASKVPERWFPGAFDFFGNAHNLWHLAVLGGIIYHYIAMLQFFSVAFKRAELDKTITQAYKRIVNKLATAAVTTNLLRDWFSSAAMETWTTGGTDVEIWMEGEVDVFDIGIIMGVVNEGILLEVVKEPAANSVRGFLEGLSTASASEHGASTKVGLGVATRNGETVKVRMAPVELVIGWPGLAT
ncbi:hypothetical protein NUW58_g6278 [Xylaria curta]|uniref:Uncharacterized protein n=1 Tax=Xylaria curta TaxID=42375 RepID=A0ACC1NXR0_9PEZI|nr:hypothetical protein NUW58_g6278 [Xylaria curta]